jgi:ectoine hydroxylase
VSWSIKDERIENMGLKKTVYTSVSNRDFTDKTSRAWLDINDSASVAPIKDGFYSFSGDTQVQLSNWSRNGFLHIKEHFHQNRQKK